jgi:hypothetical protein
MTISVRALHHAAFRLTRPRISAVLFVAVFKTASANAVEDIEFVAEHLPEVAMDNRYGALPLWSSAETTGSVWSYAVQGGYESIGTGNLKLAGPMLSFAVSHPVSNWTLGGFAFVDALKFSGDNDYRPLQTLFSPHTPIVRPVDSRFDALDGRMQHYGAGIRASMSSRNSWLGAYRWTAGLLWERIELRDYRFTYEVLAGDSMGTKGQIDFDATYVHLTPLLGMEWPRNGENWAMTPHALVAWPLPRRGVVGHITGPGFDLHGDTAEVGAGKHFGDPSVTIGLDITYLPAHFTVDVGMLVTQHYFEQFIHEGIDANWLLSCVWHY